MDKSTDKSIIDLLSQSQEPLTAIQIAKRVVGPKATKKDVNPALYRMLKSGQVSQTPDQPPKWETVRQSPALPPKDEKIKDIIALLQSLSIEDLDKLRGTLTETTQQ